MTVAAPAKPLSSSFSDARWRRHTIARVLAGSIRGRTSCSDRVWTATHPLPPAPGSVPQRPPPDATRSSTNLSVAGATRPIFSDEALALIAHVTQGSPRSINNLATAALLAEYLEQKTIVDEQSVRRAVADFDDVAG